jgi:hypothetical protein
VVIYFDLVDSGFLFYLGNKDSIKGEVIADILPTNCLALDDTEGY